MANPADLFKLKKIAKLNYQFVILKFYQFSGELSEEALFHLVMSMRWCIVTFVEDRVRFVYDLTCFDDEIFTLYLYELKLMW